MLDHKLEVSTVNVITRGYNVGLFKLSIFRIFEIIVSLLGSCYISSNARCGGYSSPSIIARSIWKSFLKYE